MKNKKFKFFSKSNKIETIFYDETSEYYSFLKNQFDQGYRQVIISTSLIISLLKELSTRYGMQVYKIEFNEDDEELAEEMSQLIQSIQKNPAYICLLCERLEFLSDDSSIDISRISFKGKIETIHVDIKIQSNGIVIVNEEAHNIVDSIIKPMVERGVFG